MATRSSSPRSVWHLASAFAGVACATVLVVAPDRELAAALGIRAPGFADALGTWVARFFVGCVAFGPAFLLPWPRAHVRAVPLAVFAVGVGLAYAFTRPIASADARLLGVAGAIATLLLGVRCSTTTPGARLWLAGVSLSAVLVAGYTVASGGLRLAPGLGSAIDISLRGAGMIAAASPPAFFTVAQRVLVHPNALADQGIVLVGATASLGVLARRRAEAAVAIALVLVALALVAATGSRAAFAAGGISVGSMALAGASASSRARVLAGIASSGLLVALALPEAKVADLAVVNDVGVPEAVLARLQTWSSYWELLRHWPVRGAGLGLEAVAARYADTFGVDLVFSDPHAHNWVLQGALETSAFGMAGFAMLTLPSTFAAFRDRHAWRAGGDVVARARAIVSTTIAAMLLHNLFEANLSTNVCLAQLLALVAVDIGTETADPLRAPGRWADLRRALGIAVVVAAVIALAGTSTSAPFAPRLNLR